MDPDFSVRLNSAAIGTIEIQDILAFCSEKHTEGIDLDYKQNWPKDLARIICAFANTQGGLILMGVEEEGKTREPKLPVHGMPLVPSTARQQIDQISSEAIYPPVAPEVAICRVADQDERYVLLIRVQPSKFMHATDGRRKIYVRIRDNNKGYDLASLSELEWMWQRKTALDETRRQIYESAVQHSESAAIPWGSADEQAHWQIVPKLIVSLIPSFPTAQPVIDSDSLLAAVKTLPQLKSTWKNVDRTLPNRTDCWRSIPGGVCDYDRGYTRWQEYLEFGQLAHVHIALGMETAGSAPFTPPVTAKDSDYTWAYIVLSYLDLALRLADKFYTAIGYSWPIGINVLFRASSNLRLDPDTPLVPNSKRLISSYSPDSELQVLLLEVAPAQLISDDSLLSTAAYNLFWAFGLGWSRDKVQKWISDTIPHTE
jgi:hypothetical protein